MTKAETRETNHALSLYAAGLADAGYAARIISSLIRSALGKNTRQEILQKCELFPAVLQHPDFIA